MLLSADLNLELVEQSRSLVIGTVTDLDSFDKIRADFSHSPFRAHHRGLGCVLALAESCDGVAECLPLWTEHHGDGKDAYGMH